MTKKGSAASDISSTLARASKEKLRRLARGARGGLVTTARAAALLRQSPAEASATLARLMRQGWLLRVRRGLYLVLPLEAGREGGAVEDPWILARELYAPCYIGGWTAAEHWGLTEQLFRSTFVVTAAAIRHAADAFLGTEFHLVRAKKSHVENVRPIWRGRERIAVSDRERTIADALASPSWVGGIRHLAEIFRSYRSAKEWNPNRLIERVGEVGSGAAFKRLGYLAETVLSAESVLVDAALARRSAGVVKLDPAVEGRGRLTKRWGLWVNVRLDGSPAEV
jgi:predicted transcriptional regulator of viral defense system